MGIALACLVLPAACAPTPAPSPRGRLTNQHGKSAPALVAMNAFSARVLPGPALARQLAAMHAYGVQVVRSDAPWAAIEPQPPGPGGPRWRFSEFDRWVGALAAHGLRWAPILDYSVSWAKTCPRLCPPASNATYAAFARAVTQHYGAHGSFWFRHRTLPYLPARIFEIWNEENDTRFWSTGPNPGQYARLYAAARNAIRGVDPSASVIVGGLTTQGADYDPSRDPAAGFVQDMFAAEPGLKGQVDGFGLHPYAASADGLLSWVVHFRQVLDRLGEHSTPIDITEFGWPTGGPASELARADGMRILAVALGRSDCGVRLLAPYDWINPVAAADPADFGLVDRTGADARLRLAGTAWFEGLAQAHRRAEVALC